MYHAIQCQSHGVPFHVKLCKTMPTYHCCQTVSTYLMLSTFHISPCYSIVLHDIQFPFTMLDYCVNQQTTDNNMAYWLTDSQTQWIGYPMRSDIFLKASLHKQMSRSWDIVPTSHQKFGNLIWTKKQDMLCFSVQLNQDQRILTLASPYGLPPGVLRDFFGGEWVG